MHIDRIGAGDPFAIADNLTSRFCEEFGRAPLGCFRAPGRVNLIGEHLDYNEGRCLPMALPHATYAVVAPREDAAVRLVSLQQDRPWRGTVDSLGPGQVEGWAAYVAGVLWALREDGLELPGVDLMVDSTVPVGGGLSSSAALECSVALALCVVAGVEVDDEMRHRLVRACIRAETEVAGAPTGGMDQTISLFGEDAHALLLDCRDYSFEQLPWSPRDRGLELVVVDTRASHSLVDGGYQARRRDCERAAQVLGVRSLREVDDPQSALDRLEDEQVRRRAHHVFTEMARVEQSADALRGGDYAALGQLFTASHTSLRDDFEVSAPELDAVVDTALDIGASGARMTGGGFGGSALVLLPAGDVERLESAVGEDFARRGWEPPAFLPGRPSDGATRLR